ncbi:MAG: sigma-70 family RNA polymerase sigma factor, partial [Woeseiaceae bacterium]|nr:sigma-70 family RNA polymerase sigma factor [Woeseiaceae bacterium]
MNTYGSVNSSASSVATDTGYSAEQLVVLNVELVKRIALHLAARLPSTVDIDDLLQSGMVGLVEASNNFDPSRGACFATYAGIRIRGAMLDDIRKHDWTPRSVHHKYRKVTDAIGAIEAETGRRAQTDEIAERLDITVDEYHKILADSTCSRLFSLEETIDEPSWQ